MIHAVPKLIPYKFDKPIQQYVLASKDGLLELVDEIPFINEDYKKILQQHHDLLARVKTIRNKFEHKMHGARLIASGSESISLFNATYQIGDESFVLTAQELIALAKDLNTMFAKIQRLVECFASEQEKEDHPYYRRLIRFDFCNFNQIYESKLLRNIGKALLPF